ncbi:MAG: hypothetical protein IIA66_09055 [Planctomycetes bacterium]|nr:hypothetical protein [Planctomycetota bacterium]
MQISNVSLKILWASCLVFGFSTAALAGGSSCPADLDGDLNVGAFDLALLLGGWGQCPDPCTSGDPDATCAPDFDGDCAVGAFDLAVLLGSWGLCPLAPGACCGLEGPSACEQLTDENCTQVGGVFLGGGTSCAECSCGPGAGDCCTANGTAGCEETNCCEQVCDVLPSCCEVAWTSECADQATATCGALCFTTPVNDLCANAIAIFDGDTDYATFFAGTDGPAHPECQFDGRTYHDIWYDYIATCSQTVTVSTCNQAQYDTDLVVYDGCACPASDANMLGCNDDFGGPCGFTSQVTVPVNSGNCYKIRIGGWMEGSQGTGTLTVSPCPKTCIVDPECDDVDACTTDTCVGGFCSNNPINCDDGVACTDNACDPLNGCQFTANNANCNDGVACTDDTCDPLNDCQFTANNANCDDGVACTDDDCDPQIGCVNDPIDCAPVNDMCEGAIEIFDGDTAFDTTGATTAGPLAPGCGFLGHLPRLDVWYTYTASCTGLLKVCTCNQVFFDTTLVVYEGCDCPATTEYLACNDDDDQCFLNTSRMLASVVAGVCYKIRLGGYLDSDEGSGTLTVACLEGQASNCCFVNPEPGCDDQACEDLICSFDPFCCAYPPYENNGFWDGTCAYEALLFCDICAGGC